MLELIAAQLQVVELDPIPPTLPLFQLLQLFKFEPPIPPMLLLEFVLHQQDPKFVAPMPPTYEQYIELFMLEVDPRPLELQMFPT